MFRVQGLRLESAGGSGGRTRARGSPSVAAFRGTRQPIGQGSRVQDSGLRGRGFRVWGFELRV